MVDTRIGWEAIQLKGWFHEPYRHSLAARGVTLKSREELDYALHRRGEIYPGEMAQYIWYDFRDKYGDEFNDYRPIPGEIQSLRNIRELMDIYERRRYRPLTPQEVGILRFLVMDFKNKVKPEHISLSSRVDEYHMLTKYLRGFSSSESRDMIFAAETVLYLMHWDGDAVERYLGKDFKGKNSVSVSGKVVLEALNLQRGGRAGSGETPIGEGQMLIDLWMEELERRRLT